MSNNHKGYALFLDVEDKDTRIENQATVLANIFEDNLEKTGTLRGRFCNNKGADILVGYFNRMNPNDKDDIAIIYKELMVERGFKEMFQ